MATLEDDTPDAFKGLLYPGMVIAGKDVGRYVPCYAMTTMPPRRTMAPTQDVGLAAQLNELRQMMLAQQQEIGGLRAQMAQQNRGPLDAEVPPAPVNQPTAPEIPNADPMIP
ncbi:hypothetical protein TIFTF001_046938 [Ficus carica]|uniref:Uncharacterized protein n=1 Tax=Ficus carica TaxID=3494 RepID=A0AA87Z5M5_FICCA|nr:hypothetical protein TIFTF001_046936 [Ficus carica]GMN19330.1 hypothetical protein TIFTF001_046938 [Ficus carica]